MNFWHRHTVIAVIIALVCTFIVAACSSGPSNSKAGTPTATTQTGINVPAQGNTPDPTQSSTSLIPWPAFDGGGQRSGINSNEKTITPGNVGQLTRLWQKTLPEIADSSPVELPNVKTSSGTIDLLFVTTMKGSILALDASAGQLVWQQHTSGPKFTTSSPAIDPSGQYVYSYGLDGKVHKYAVGNGAEQTGNGWPAIITLMPDVEKGSSSLNIANGYLYMTTSGYPGDAGHYQGHVVAVKLSTGAVNIFNSLCANIHQLLDNVSTDANYCPDVQSGIWARAGAVVDASTGNVFVTTGNGNYTANTGGYDYGDSIIELSSDLQKVIDTYTPNDFSYLQSTDLDLGGDAPALLPMQKGSATPYLAVQGGKDSKLRLLNARNLSGQGGPGHVGGELQVINLPVQGGVFAQPIAWNDAHGTTWVFVTNGSGLNAFKVVTDTQGHTTLQVAYHNSNAGSSPLIADGVLFVQDNGVLRAMDPTTGSVLWNSSQSSAGGSIGGLHWQSPIVVNGHVYVPDEDGHMTAYGLK